MSTHAVSTLEAERHAKAKHIKTLTENYKWLDAQMSGVHQSIVNAQQELNSVEDAIERLRPGGSKAPKMLTGAAQ